MEFVSTLSVPDSKTDNERNPFVVLPDITNLLDPYSSTSYLEPYRSDPAFLENNRYADGVFGWNGFSSGCHNYRVSNEM
jgi:hypothetical protein